MGTQSTRCQRVNSPAHTLPSSSTTMRWPSRPTTSRHSSSPQALRSSHTGQDFSPRPLTARTLTTCSPQYHLVAVAAQLPMVALRPALQQQERRRRSHPLHPTTAAEEALCSRRITNRGALSTCGLRAACVAYGAKARGALNIL